MKLKFIDNLPVEDFDRFVKAHDSGSFLQSSGWGKWMEENGRKPMRPAVADTEGNILIAGQIFRTPIPKLSGHYIYIPYGPVAISDDPEISNYFLDNIKKRFPSAWFLRLEPKQLLFVEENTTKNIQPG